MMRLRFNPKNLIETEMSVSAGVVVFAFFGAVMVGLVRFATQRAVLLSSSEITSWTIYQQTAIEKIGLLLPTQLHDWPYWFIQLNVEQYFSVNPRLISLGFSLIGLIVFYQLVKSWFGRHDSLWALVLLSSNVAFLLSSTLVSMSAGYLVLLVACSLLSLTLLYRRQDSSVFWTAVTTAIGLYAGLIGWVVSGLTLSGLAYHIYKRRISVSRRSVAISLFVFSLMATPFIALLVAGTGMVQLWPHIVSLDLNSFLRTLEFVVFGLATPSIATAPTWPLLTIAELTLIILALLLLKRKHKATRYRVVTALFILALTGAVWLGPSAAFVALFLPISVMLTLAASRYLRDHWLALFPRNKTARTISKLGMYAVLGSVILLNVYRSYYLWPHIEPQANHPATSAELESSLLLDD